jgi:hypothetical protein
MKTRSFARLSTAAAVLASATILAAPSARAVMSNVRFDGLGGFGVSQATATASGIPILPVGGIDPATGLTVTQDLLEGTVAAGPPGTATSQWSVTNDTGGGFLGGDLYLVFTRPLDNTITVNGLPQLVSYAPEDVGLTLHNDVGGLDWVILQVPSGLDLYYYPAVLLGSLGADETSSQFAVNYILDDPQIFLDPSGFELGLPRWQLRSLFVPIPEPASVLLVAAGLGALAARRLRRCA